MFSSMPISLVFYHCSYCMSALAQRAYSVGKERLTRKRINHGGCDKKAVKHIRVDSLSDYSDEVFLNRAVKKNAKYLIFHDSATFTRDQVFVSCFCLYLKCSRSLILSIEVLYSVHLAC